MFKQKLLMAIAILMAFVIGFFSNSIYIKKSVGNKASIDEQNILYWVAPMDASFRKDKPGKSPMGMDLVAVYADEKSGIETDGNAVRISAAVANNLGLRIAAVTFKPLPQEIVTFGNIAFSDDLISHIHSRSEGWIEKLNVNSIGSKVEKGDVLYELYSPELVNAQEEYLAVLASGNHKLLQSAKRRLLLLDFTGKQINRLNKRRKVQRRIEVYAPHSGVISELKVREGMFIKPAVKIMAVGNLNKIWVVAEVFERQAGWLKEGQRVDMQVSSFPNKKWQGTVQYVYPEFDKKSRSAQVRLQFDNDDLLLKPNMVAQLSIKAGSNDKRLLVPAQAVIHTANNQRVVKQISENKYQSTGVKIGIESAGFIEIVEGVEQGDRVVISAQFLIDSESNIDAEILRMDDREENHPSDDSAMDMHSMQGEHDDH